MPIGGLATAVAQVIPRISEKESLGRKDMELDGQTYDVEGYHVSSGELGVERWYDGDVLPSS